MLQYIVRHRIKQINLKHTKTFGMREKLKEINIKVKLNNNTDYIIVLRHYFVEENDCMVWLENVNLQCFLNCEVLELHYLASVR